MDTNKYKILKITLHRGDVYLPLVLIKKEWRFIYMPDGEPSEVNFNVHNANPNYERFEMKTLIEIACKNFEKAKERLKNYILNYEDNVISTEEIFFTKEELLQ